MTNLVTTNMLAYSACTLYAHTHYATHLYAHTHYATHMDVKAYTDLVMVSMSLVYGEHPWCRRNALCTEHHR